MASFRRSFLVWMKRPVPTNAYCELRTYLLFFDSRRINKRSVDITYTLFSYNPSEERYLEKKKKKNLKKKRKEKQRKEKKRKGKMTERCRISSIIANACENVLYDTWGTNGTYLLDGLSFIAYKCNYTHLRLCSICNKRTMTQLFDSPNLISIFFLAVSSETKFFAKSSHHIIYENNKKI